MPIISHLFLLSNTSFSLDIFSKCGIMMIGRDELFLKVNMLTLTEISALTFSVDETTTSPYTVIVKQLTERKRSEINLKGKY